MLRGEEVFRISICIATDHMSERRFALLAARRNSNAVPDH